MLLIFPLLLIVQVKLTVTRNPNMYMLRTLGCLTGGLNLNVLEEISFYFYVSRTVIQAQSHCTFPHTRYVKFLGILKQSGTLGLCHFN